MTTLKVQKRDMETKAKRLRRNGYVTGNLFGKEFEGSIPLKIEKQELGYRSKNDFLNTLFERLDDIIE